MDTQIITTLRNHPKYSIRAFIVENLFLGETAFDDDDSLIEAGALDSTAAMELVEFLQTTFSFNVNDDEINQDNLETVNRIVAFVERKTAVAHAVR